MATTPSNSLIRPLSELSREINAEHTLAEGAAVTALEHAKRTGDLLAEAKSQVPHGEWLAWLEKNCDVSPRQSQRYIKVATNWERISAKNDAASYLTIDDAISNQKPHVANNSGDNEWYTPPRFIDAARLVLGAISLDPASSAVANETVQATNYYSSEDDGLSKQWSGNVWMNPPYAQPLIGQFCDRLVEHVSDGTVTSAIVLVNNATETKWFQSMLSCADAVCFPSSRIRFVDLDGNPSGSPLQGQALIYFGSDRELFAREFREFGNCVEVPS